MSHPSRSNETNNEPKQLHPWLQKHYQEKRERTVRLVKAAVDLLVKAGQTVTIEAICRKSIEVDPDGRGVKKSAILENPEAHAYYREHSISYRAVHARIRQKTHGNKPSAPTAQPQRIDPNRNVDRARYRYMQMTKPAIVERSLTVEQAYAEMQQQLAHLQFQLLEQGLQQERGMQQGKHHHTQKSEKG